MDQQEGFYKDLLDNLYDGVYFLDVDRRITYWNKGAERLTGYDADEVVGSLYRENILEHVDEKGTRLCESSLCPAAKTLRDGQVRDDELFLHHKEGYRVPVNIRVAPITRPEGTIIGAVEIFSDASSSVNARYAIEQLQRMALLDSLTEVGNRRYAEMNLRSRLGEKDRYGWDFGVLFIDIDNFKQINDRFGHDVGDDFLKMTAHTLSRNIRTFDLVCRWGGEEFLSIIVNVDRDRLVVVAEKLRAMMEQSRIPLDSTSVSATISIGATMANPDDTVDSLIRRADELMYESKAEGRNRISNA